MSMLNRLKAKMARFAQALDAVDDPIGAYLASLAKRVDQLERDMEHLRIRLLARPGGGMEE